MGNPFKFSLGYYEGDTFLVMSEYVHLTTLTTTGAVETTSAMYERLYLPLIFEVTTDSDGDGVPDVNDNCVSIANPAQSDSDADNVGDACDLCSGTYGPDNRDRDLRIGGTRGGLLFPLRR